MVKTALLNLPMPIKTPRLLLRPPQLGDGAMVNAAVLESFDLLHGTMPWAHEKPSVDDSEEYARQGAANWIVKKDEEPYLPIFMFDNQTGQFVGGTGYHTINWDVPCLEIGYWIRTPYAGKGLMTEAVNALTQYAFKQLGVKRVAITCDITNERSKKIPERLDFHLEGTMKFNRLTLSGTTSHTLIFARYDIEGLPKLAIDY